MHVEPSNLPEEFQSLIIGADSVTWYQKEIDKYSEKLKELTSGKRKGNQLKKRKKESKMRPGRVLSRFSCNPK